MTDLSPPPATAWHTVGTDAALSQLDSHADTGLSAQAVVERRSQYGPNELEETGGRPAWRILLDQFTNIMLLMLIAVAVVSGVLSFRNQEFPKDAIAIFAIVILNGVLGYLQESRAEKALAALKQMASPSVLVQRDGRLQEVPSQDLVPGDIMLLEAGDQVAADGRLLEAVNLQLRESALTGEAQGVNKQANYTLADETALAERKNLVFQGTEVVQGRGRVLITNTGMKTELGRIAAMLQGVETEPTPLQQRMTQLGNVLVTGSLTLVAIVVVGGVTFAGWESFERLLEVALSMAVAVVPEGLPAVITVTLAIGTQRMVRRHALIRRLPAVETLGSVTTICSDKTGTLTQNKMVVQQVRTLSETLQITGDGYAPEGDFVSEGQLVDPRQSADIGLLLLDGLLCNDSVLQKEAGDWAIMGDPTEGALVVMAAKSGLDRHRLGHELRRMVEFPFSSERKRMSVVLSGVEALRSDLNLPGNVVQAPYLMLAKGSPEMLLECCTSHLRGAEGVPLGEQARSQILSDNADMAAQGLRVLGFAYRPLEAVPAEGEADRAEQDLVWLGLVGMIDALRPEVRVAVERCRSAGIRPMMITGDHQLTAMAIAQDLGIADREAQSLSGADLEKMSQAELEAAVRDVNIYARVSPEHKLRIVKALQKDHQIVAMTGDGVNDAPALKQAEIGIAMGITGTDVSKEASDMVLLDDNFATIVAATEEGRVVYTNIRRFVKYILGSNIGELLTIALSPLILPILDVPLTPLQILWMNLVTDGFPALALAVEPAEPDVMERSPHDPQESIFARGLGAYMLRIGVVFAIISVTMMVWAYNWSQQGGDPDRWKTMVFTTLCLAQMGHAIAVRSSTRLTIEMSPWSNPFVLAAVLLTCVLQLMLIYVEPLRNFFGTHMLSSFELLICFGFSTLLFVWVEFEKIYRRLRGKIVRD
ncbi:cation-translocating P-type ATPase [Nodosilinea sp. LEGE 07298]|uniref:cation-translocating P-type ATPase n=1 Tax=Nodosilinea sp. LEGE 07298 TaxID=2777970 RepID=UPI001882EF1D|nr:cation-translocating P-type ATPase [Nodosilinea sp. LEGE 07298]MBE9113314.1 cation-translocating P-type ATPase [Nodosilinea sp. LEGE 07298]